MISFSKRRKFWKAYVNARWKHDQLQYKFWDDIVKYKPRPHDLLGLFMLFFYTDCPICYAARLFTVGSICGLIVGIVFGMKI